MCGSTHEIQITNYYTFGSSQKKIKQIFFILTSSSALNASTVPSLDNGLNCDGASNGRLNTPSCTAVTLTLIAGLTCCADGWLLLAASSTTLLTGGGLREGIPDLDVTPQT